MGFSLSGGGSSHERTSLRLLTGKKSGKYDGLEMYFPRNPMSGAGFDELKAGLAVGNRELTGNFLHKAANIPTYGLFG
jgi:hypothetical protein